MATKIRSIGGDIEVTGSLSINGIDNATIPAGIIILWNSVTPPSGWALCDGSNGTPNLSDKFVVGSGSTYTPGQTGGNFTKSLSTPELPSHQHSAYVYPDDHPHSHTSTGGYPGGHSWYAYNGYAGWWENQVKNTVGISSAYLSHGHNGSVATSGSGSAFPLLPSFYTLYYIMKL